MGIPNLTYGCNTIRQHVVCIHDLYMTLTYLRLPGVSLVGFTHNFYSVSFCTSSVLITVYSQSSVILIKLCPFFFICTKTNLFYVDVWDCLKNPGQWWSKFTTDGHLEYFNWLPVVCHSSLYLFVWGFTSHSRIFTSMEMSPLWLRFLKFWLTPHSVPLCNEGFLKHNTPTTLDINLI